MYFFGIPLVYATDSTKCIKDFRWLFFTWAGEDISESEYLYCRQQLKKSGTSAANVINRSIIFLICSQINRKYIIYTSKVTLYTLFSWRLNWKTSGYWGSPSTKRIKLTGSQIVIRYRNNKHFVFVIRLLNAVVSSNKWKITE